MHNDNKTVALEKSLNSTKLNQEDNIKKSSKNIFSDINNKYDWKAEVREYFIKSSDHAPKISNPLLNTLWDIIAFLEYDINKPEDIVDKMSTILDLFTANGIYSVEEGLIQPMVISVKNILTQNTVASNTAGLEKSQIEIATQTISKERNDLATFIYKELQKSYNNNNLK
jgi:hypothetical protein